MLKKIQLLRKEVLQTLEDICQFCFNTLKKQEIKFCYDCSPDNKSVNSIWTTS